MNKKKKTEEMPPYDKSKKHEVIKIQTVMTLDEALLKSVIKTSAKKHKKETK